MILAVEDLEIDLVRSGVWRDDRLQELSPRALDLLVHLVENRDRVVSHDEIRAEVWDGREVGDSAILEAVRQARRALGARTGGGDFIESVYAHGYRFVGSSVRKLWVVSRNPDRVPHFDDREDAEPLPLLEMILRALDAALAGYPTTVLLCGPGGGELRDRALAAAAERGVEVLRAVCPEAGGGGAVGAWEPIARELGSRPAVEAGDASRLVRALRDRAAGSGLVVCLDGLERADAGTLELCERVGAQTAATRVLLLATYDESLADEARADAGIGRLVRETGGRVLRA